MSPELSPPIFDLLVALSQGPQHGYALMKSIEAAHGGHYKPSPGVIYSNLQRLVDARWAKEVGAPKNSTDERRKHYEITEQGLGAARTHCAQAQAKLTQAAHVLGAASC